MTGQTVILPIDLEDVDLLWLVLYYASRSDEEEGITPEAIKKDPELSRYVAGWGRLGDVGVKAVLGGAAIGAAWLRLPGGEDAHDYSYVDDATPELAIATLPGNRGGGAGSAMMGGLLEVARDDFPGIVLTVRASSRAVALYERFGFTTIGRVINRVGTESLKMYLRLE